MDCKSIAMLWSNFSLTFISMIHNKRSFTNLSKKRAKLPLSHELLLAELSEKTFEKVKNLVAILLWDFMSIFGRMNWNCYLHIYTKSTQYSMMINHHPYNAPERPPTKHNRLTNDSGSSQYRKSDSIDNSHNFLQYASRPPLGSMNPPNNILKKSTMEDGSSFRPPLYQPSRPDSQHYMPNPKSQQTSSASNLPSLPPNSPRPSYTISSTVEKKDTLRESFGVHHSDIKDLNDRI